jgi:hypothetical protein
MIEDPQVSEEIGRSPIGDALDAARRLLAAADVEAARLRADAEQQARRRELEAELLVAKARRLLEAAEARASVIVATARSSMAADLPDVDLRSDVDLTSVGLGPARRVGSGGNRFDSLLAAAIASAVGDAFPEHRAAQLTD